jgi:hypothetical protein
MGMSDLMTPSIQDRLWHTMRQDLVRFVPEVAGTRLLMCCACGRFLPRECFDLEHLIPQQALKQDPEAIRTNPATPANVRGGNLLLCKKPLKYKGKMVHENGCNSWKGRHYDKRISELVSGEAWEGEACTQVHIIGALSLGYLAMVAHFGYIVALMRSGLLMRYQFFSPYKYHPDLPERCKILLGGSVPATSPEAQMWANPFSFEVTDTSCIVVARNFAVTIPVSRDPRKPLARHLRIVPSRYALRPVFTTVFD